MADEFGCAPDRVTIVPDCVNTDAFAPCPRDEAWRALRRAWGIPAGHKVVVYLGLLAEYQGTGHLLRAAQILCQQRDDVHFVVAGYPNVDQYHRLAQQLGVRAVPMTVINDRVTIAGALDEAGLIEEALKAAEGGALGTSASRGGGSSDAAPPTSPPPTSGLILPR